MSWRTVIISVIVLFLWVGAGVTAAKYYLWTYGRDNQVVLINHASEAISHGEVHVSSGRRYIFQGLAVGEMDLVTIPAHSEAGYYVEVLFQSGRKLSSSELSYLTSGIVTSDLVEIQDDKIILIKSNVK